MGRPDLLGTEIFVVKNKAQAALEEGSQQGTMWE